MGLGGVVFVFATWFLFGFLTVFVLLVSSWIEGEPFKEVIDELYSLEFDDIVPFLLGGPFTFTLVFIGEVFSIIKHFITELIDRNRK